MYDVVIDTVNTRPFMTTKFVDSGCEVFSLVFQLAREYWFSETSFPVNLLGYYWLERRWLSKYTEIPAITISESTKSDLTAMGFKHVRIVPVGVSRRPLTEVPLKSSTPTFVFVGRLTRAKRPEVALNAFQMVRSEFPDARLWIVGDGYLRRRLEGKDFPGVTFFGKVTEEEKYRLLREAHAILAPGTREGWGLSILEAAAVATPAIAYNIPGLRDSVVDKQTGIILEENSPRRMAEWAIRLIGDHELRRELSGGALAWAKAFSWDRTAGQFMSCLTSWRPTSA
jgi:glycosyltransferase involved in cell wall biosynthesis